MWEVKAKKEWIKEEFDSSLCLTKSELNSKLQSLNNYETYYSEITVTKWSRKRAWDYLKHLVGIYIALKAESSDKFAIKTYRDKLEKITKSFIQNYSWSKFDTLLQKALEEKELGS